MRFQYGPRWIWAQLPLWKDTLAAIQSVLTILAFFAAVWWFAMQGYTQATVQVEHKIQQELIFGPANTSLVWIEIKVTNSGRVPVDLETGCVQMTVDANGVVDPTVEATRKLPVKYDFSKEKSCPSTDNFEHVITSDKSDSILVYSHPLETKRLRKIDYIRGKAIKQQYLV